MKMEWRRPKTTNTKEIVWTDADRAQLRAAIDAAADHERNIARGTESSSEADEYGYKAVLARIILSGLATDRQKQQALDDPWNTGQKEPYTDPTVSSAGEELIHIDNINNIRRLGGEDTIKEIVLRRPKPEDMRGLKANDLIEGDVSAVNVLLSRISDLSRAEAEKMDLTDWYTLSVEVAIFFAPKAARTQLQ